MKRLTVWLSRLTDTVLQSSCNVFIACYLCVCLCRYVVDVGAWPVRVGAPHHYILCSCILFGTVPVASAISLNTSALWVCLCCNIVAATVTCLTSCLDIRTSTLYNTINTSFCLFYPSRLIRVYALLWYDFTGSLRYVSCEHVNIATSRQAKKLYN